MRPDQDVVLRSWLEKNAKGVVFLRSSVNGTNSDGQRQSVNGLTATKLYPIMDNHLNELLIWFRVQSVPNEWTFCFDAVLDEGSCVMGRQWH